MTHSLGLPVWVHIIQFIPPQHSSALRAAGRTLQTKVEANAATVVGLRAILRGFAMIDARRGLIMCGPAYINEDTSDFLEPIAGQHFGWLRGEPMVLFGRLSGSLLQVADFLFRT